jgi:FkbM family methyltransferase
LRKRVERRLKRHFFDPRIEVERADGLVTLGSSYGAWTFEPRPELEGSTILSCGLGEEASFDVEFATRFGARVILVDPTPRAIGHFDAISARLGRPSEASYSPGGKQNVAAYDLSALTPRSLVLEPSALWVENTTLKFYSPPDPAHVSHSISNFQNDYAQDTPHIEVAAVSPRQLLQKHGIETVPLVKMDIEGAELDVIPHMLETGILPGQLLVEYDEMNFPSRRSMLRIQSVDAKLRAAGYKCRHFDGESNFLYCR